MLKITLVLLGAALMATSACNTLRGAGRDVEQAGEAVQDAATPGKK